MIYLESSSLKQFRQDLMLRGLRSGGGGAGVTGMNCPMTPKEQEMLQFLL